MKNLLNGFKRSNFQYSNMAEEDDFSLIETAEDGISFIPEAHTGMYCDPEGKKDLSNAAFMYKEVSGDFAARVHMDLDFVYAEDAAAIMIYADEKNWATGNFEKVLLQEENEFTFIILRIVSERFIISLCCRILCGMNVRRIYYG